MATKYNPMNKPVDSLLDECESLDDIAYAIQKLNFAAQQLAKMERSGTPLPEANQIWKVDLHGVVSLKDGFRDNIKVISEFGKEVAEKDGQTKLRLWLHQRNGVLLANSLSELAYMAYPELDADSEDSDDTQTEIALLPVE